MTGGEKWDTICEGNRRGIIQKLIPFWENLRDEEYGGFYGYMGYDLKVQKVMKMDVS